MQLLSASECPTSEDALLALMYLLQVHAGGGELVSCCLLGLGLSLGESFLREKGAARHGVKMEQPDLIYTGSHPITSVSSVSAAP